MAWEVEVRVDGAGVLTIGSEGYLAGLSDIEKHADAVRAAGEHLLSFIGPADALYKCFICQGEDEENCPICSAALQSKDTHHD